VLRDWGARSAAFGQRSRLLIKPNHRLRRQPVNCGQSRFRSQWIKGLREKPRPRRSSGLRDNLRAL
jgi:hypothetical protein